MILIYFDRLRKCCSWMVCSHNVLNVVAAWEQDIETKVQKLHDEHGFAIIELQFLYDALRQVRACRRVLKWTYVYGYYLDDSSAAQPQVEFHDGSVFSRTPSNRFRHI